MLLNKKNGGFLRFWTWFWRLWGQFLWDCLVHEIIFIKM